MNILKKLIKWLALALLAVGVAVAILWLLNGPESLAENSRSKTRLGQAKYSLSQVGLNITDRNRPTPAMGGFEGADTRTLNGTIWFPEGASSALPLIVYSHGFGGHHKESRHLAEYLASNGYVVAAVDFPLSSLRSPVDVPQLLDVVNQPGDVTAVIDKLLSLNSDPNSVMHQRIDVANIGAMGLSLGGLTTALVAYHPDLRDSRIKAVAMLAPPLESFSDQFYSSSPGVKSLVMSGTLDRVVPEPANATEVKARHLNGWFVSVSKGTHLGFSNLGNPLRWMDNPDDLGCGLLDMMLAKLDLPERWSAVIPNTGGVLRDIVAGAPCPQLPGKAMNGVKQQWLTRITIGSFFDAHLQAGVRAAVANNFFNTVLDSENPEISLTSPR